MEWVQTELPSRRALCEGRSAAGGLDEGSARETTYSMIWLMWSSQSRYALTSILHMMTIGRLYQYVCQYIANLEQVMLGTEEMHAWDLLTGCH